MAVNLINSNDIEVEQTGNDIQLKTSTPLSTIEGNIGNLSLLNTTDKSSLVNAVNEINGKIPDIYSTSTEIETNKVLGNKKVYRSYLDFAHTSAGTYTYTHNLGIDTIVSLNAFCSIANQPITDGIRQMPIFNLSNGSSFSIDKITTNTIITTATNWTNNHAYIWIEYTKSS
jgi:hypothetical protein